MAVKDFFAGVSARATDVATGVDLQSNEGQTYIVIGAGGAVTGLSFEESTDNVTYTAIADEDLLFSTNTGVELQGTPADGKIADGEIGLVRYRGVARYIRGAGTNATVLVARGCADRRANPLNDIAD